MNSLQSGLALPASHFPRSYCIRWLLIPLCLFAASLHLDAYDREVWTSFPNMNSVTSLAEGETQIFVGTTGGIRRYDRFYDHSH